MTDQPLSTPPPTSPRYRFTIVSAVYNVARYLPEFMGSLDAQTFPHERIQLIAVDDGSTDDSATILKEWAENTRISVMLLSKENGGQSSARNLGIPEADGEWVTFADPDDMLDPEYFTQIDAFLTEHPEARMVAANLLNYHDDTGMISDRHPLKKRFAGGDQLVDIDRFPSYFHLSGGTVFFPGHELDESLRFDEKVAPTFEDAHLVQRYLLRQEHRLVGFVRSARYLYRRRSDGTSTLQSSGTDARKYTDVLRFGYLDLLETAAESLGIVPRWLQNVVIYDLTWYLRADESIASPSSGLSGSASAEFHSLFEQIRLRLDDTTISGFTAMTRPISQREVFQHGYGTTPWIWDKVVVNRHDAGRQLVELRYRFNGAPPAESIRVRGLPTEAMHSKVRSLNYLQQPRLFERVAWVSARGTIEVDLDGSPVPLTFAWPQQDTYSVRPSEILAKRRQPRSAVERPGRIRRKGRKITLADRQALALSRLRAIRRLFAGAWVLMDRDLDSHDNAEHLFRYLRKHRRDINAWFVVRRGSADWDRLKREGYRRLIPHGSMLWKALCLNAQNIVSSHAEKYVYTPFTLGGGQTPSWKFTFLQHGIIKDDLSRWLNGKPIDAMVASTQAEFASLVGNYSPYSLTTREVHLTGLPRYDRLAGLAASSAETPANRSVVIMPTWRYLLMGDTSGDSAERGLSDAFLQSDFAIQWLAVLNSPELKSLADRHGLTIDFMPHPNIQPYLPLMDLPSHVRIKTYADDDVQEVLAGAALVVTDYSSIAFDAAFIRRPVAYFQFDKDAVFGGGHTTRPGYFSYEEDGFGPVSADHESLLTDIGRILENGTAPLPEYLERIEATFTAPRTGACERVVKMIEDLTVPISPRRAARPVIAPEAPPIKYPS